MEHIHTIPVLDALRDPMGCAFCVMLNKLEADAVNFTLGPSYMEEDVRMETNKVGFCRHHMNAMYKHQNRLGLALMLHSHLQQLNYDTHNLMQNRTPAPFFRKNKNSVGERLKNHLKNVGETCYICKKIENTYEKYTDTFFHLWNKGGEDAKLIQSQKSYCLPHTVDLLTKIETRSKREKYLDTILPTLKNFMTEAEGDLSWFIQKFDHINADEPWKNSKDALPRVIAMLGGLSQ